ncbi:hypothetical protein CURTO8I2_60147 [Curtobacterium sp. 8I-2]|nr:hypothetical protein CURTO8I2_60147 [Curtobacterium sp. 8I-2]
MVIAGGAQSATSGSSGPWAPRTAGTDRPRSAVVGIRVDTTALTPHVIVRQATLAPARRQQRCSSGSDRASRNR